MKELNFFCRRLKFVVIFKEIFCMELKDYVLVLSGLWNIVMFEFDDFEFLFFGLFECMLEFI